MNLILAVIVYLLLLAALPACPYSAGWGYYPSGGLGMLFLILVARLFAKRRTLF
jgi:hypothetical protein